MNKSHSARNETRSRDIPISKNNIEEIYNTLNEQLPSNHFLIIFAHVDSNKGILNQHDLEGTLRKEKWNKSKIKVAQWTKDSFSYSSGILDNIGKNISNDYQKKIHDVGFDCKMVVFDFNNMNLLLLIFSS
ncbi:MAG: hypothetical protein JXA99_04420 [Candidatus Lokiarchaeota archaeon]|nr:hypothetical protein [Candidatus Lokiarchaeota archaeon]